MEITAVVARMGGAAAVLFLRLAAAISTQIRGERKILPMR